MILISLIYLLLLLFVLDTMAKHDLFSKKSAKGFNLYLFYFMAVVVCLFRCMVMMCQFSAIVMDNSQPMEYFNYAFYSATFAIILIAFNLEKTMFSLTE